MEFGLAAASVGRGAREVFYLVRLGLGSQPKGADVQ